MAYREAAATGDRFVAAVRSFVSRAYRKPTRQFRVTPVEPSRLKETWEGRDCDSWLCRVIPQLFSVRQELRYRDDEGEDKGHYGALKSAEAGVAEVVQPSVLKAVGKDSRIIAQILDRWSNITVQGTLAGGHWSELAEDAVDAIAAGWLPLFARSEDDPRARTLVVSPRPGSIAIPERMVQSQGAALVSVRTPVSLRSLPTVEVPVQPVSVWKAILASTPQEGALRALRPLASGKGGSTKLVESIAAKASWIETKGRANTALVIGFARRNAPAPLRLVLQAPWKASVSGLPPSVVRVLRHYNGVTLEGASPTVRWFEFQGSKDGFDVEWDVWEVRDNADGLWTPKPLAPFTDGQDLWAYHPAQLKGATLELVRIEHEVGDIEPESEQDAADRFLKFVAQRLGV